MSEDQERKIGKLTIKAAQEMLDSFPDDAQFVQGKLVLSGKQVKEKFKTDPEFAAQVAEKIVKLKLDVFIRKS